MIKETIVVEGKSDMVAVLRAVDAHIIITSGMGVRADTLALIQKAQDTCGVIILTDPDSAGETIRRIISTRVSGVKHAFISKEDAYANGDIGIENASIESIREALSKVRTDTGDTIEVFGVADMLECGLTGDDGAAVLRGKMGKILGIGYCGAKQFTQRLNRYGVTIEEFQKAYEGAKNET